MLNTKRSLQSKSGQLLDFSRSELELNQGEEALVFWMDDSTRRYSNSTFSRILLCCLDLH